MAIAAGRRDVTPMGNARTKEFICVRVRLHGSNRQECAERVAAETWEAGASGVEEQALHEGAGEWNRGSAGPGAASNSVGLLLLIYAPREAADGVWAAAQRVIEESDEALRPEPVETVDWTQAWSRARMRATRPVGRGASSPGGGSPLPSEFDSCGSGVMRSTLQVRVHLALVDA